MSQKQSAISENNTGLPGFAGIKSCRAGEFYIAQINIRSLLKKIRSAMLRKMYAHIPQKICVKFVNYAHIEYNLCEKQAIYAEICTRQKSVLIFLSELVTVHGPVNRSQYHDK